MVIVSVLSCSFLQNELCKCEAGGISGTLPDICIVYKLHLECGRLINLYDWLQVSAISIAYQLNTLQSFLDRYNFSGYILCYILILFKGQLHHE